MACRSAVCAKKTGLNELNASRQERMPVDFFFVETGLKSMYCPNISFFNSRVHRSDLFKTLHSCCRANFRFFQTERVCKRQFQIRQK